MIGWNSAKYFRIPDKSFLILYPSLQYSTSGIVILEGRGTNQQPLPLRISTPPPPSFSDLTSARLYSRQEAPTRRATFDIVPKAISSTHTISSNLKYRKKPQRRELSRLNNMVYKKVSKHFLVKSQKGQYKNSFF